MKNPLEEIVDETMVQLGFLVEPTREIIRKAAYIEGWEERDSYKSVAHQLKLKWRQTMTKPKAKKEKIKVEKRVRYLDAGGQECVFAGDAFQKIVNSRRRNAIDLLLQSEKTDLSTPFYVAQAILMHWAAMKAIMAVEYEMEVTGGRNELK